MAELVEKSVSAEEITESKASVRLGKKVEAMISRLDSTLGQLEKEYVAGDRQGLASVQQDDK